MHAAIVTIKNDLHAFAVSKAIEDRHGWRCDVIEADCLAGWLLAGWIAQKQLIRGLTLGAVK